MPSKLCANCGCPRTSHAVFARCPGGETQWQEDCVFPELKVVPHDTIPPGVVVVTGVDQGSPGGDKTAAVTVVHDGHLELVFIDDVRDVELNAEQLEAIKIWYRENVERINNRLVEDLFHPHRRTKK